MNYLARSSTPALRGVALETRVHPQNGGGGDILGNIAHKQEKGLHIGRLRQKGLM